MTPPMDLPYFPRPGLLENVLKIFHSGLSQGVTLFAPRRQGKTSFVVKELIPAAEMNDWLVLYLDLWKRRGEPETALVEGLEDALRSKRGVFGKRFAVKTLRAKVLPPGGHLETEMEPTDRPAEDVLENRLASAIDALVASHQTTLLVIDEFQALAGVKRADFVAGLRTALQKHQGKLLVFYTGSSREALNNMFRRQKAPLFESAYSMTLPNLGADFVQDRALFLRDRTGIVVKEKVLDAAFDRLGRTPEFLNKLVIGLMIAGNADVESALQEWFTSQRENGIGPVLEELNDIDRGILQMLAQREHPSLFSVDAVALLEQLTPAECIITIAKVQASIKRLVQAGLVAPTGQKGEYEIDDLAVLSYLREMPEDDIE